MTTTYSTDLNQGTDAQGRTFGYVHGDDGGFFFTWMPTLESTLDSVDEDEVDGDGGLTAAEVREWLALYLPTTKRAVRVWGTGEYPE